LLWLRLFPPSSSQAHSNIHKHRKTDFCPVFMRPSDSENLLISTLCFTIKMGIKVYAISLLNISTKFCFAYIVYVSKFVAKIVLKCNKSKLHLELQHFARVWRSGHKGRLPVLKSCSNTGRNCFTFHTVLGAEYR